MICRSRRYLRSRREAEAGRESAGGAGAGARGATNSLSSTRPNPLMKTLDASKLLLWLSAMAGVAAALAADLPSPEEYRANWPRFRGPDGGGVCAPGDVPLTCDLKTGANIAWTAAVPA